MIWTGLGKYRDVGLLILRVGIGLLMIQYGWPKLAGGAEQWAGIGKAMGNLGITFYPVIWGFLAAMTETLGGVLLVLGFLFRPATILLTINMAVATLFVYKKSGALMDASHPLELTILFLSLIFIGAGKYSVDRS